jgi:serine/threonine-protein kinase
MTRMAFGRYEIKAQLGQGGMATVYHAFDPRFERDVAIKVLPREFLHDATFISRFEREAKTIAALEHSSIVPVHDYGEHEGQPYLVMRYMPGGSLADRIQPGPLSLEDVAAIFGRVASALDAAHAKGIVHRDVKPSNILFDAYNEAFLSDFGIVKLTEATAQLTGAGFIGTPAYMAPEMARPGGVTPLIDTYALGVTLFQALTGKLPFEADPAFAHYTDQHRKIIAELPRFRFLMETDEGIFYLDSRASRAELRRYGHS